MDFFGAQGHGNADKVKSLPQTAWKFEAYNCLIVFFLLFTVGTVGSAVFT